MRKNILITGVPHSGKSTLIKSIISNVEKKVGFLTNEILENDQRIGFEIETSNSERFMLADINKKTNYQLSKYYVNVENLDKAIFSLPRYNMNDLLYIDEIGRMELYSENFKKLTSKYLNSDNICVATITKVYTDEYIEGVKRRNDIILVGLTEENRPKKAIFIEKLINKIIKAKGYISEPERLKVIGKDNYELVSEHGVREVINNKGIWECTCDFYTQNKICSHIISVEALT